MNEMKLRKFIKDGESFKQIAKHEGCSPNKIGYWAKKYGLKSPAKIDERKYKVDDNFLDKIGEEQSYFLGLIAADGCIVKFPKCKENPYRAFSISQSGKHGLNLIKYIRDLLKSDCKIYYSKKTNSHSIQVSSVTLTSKLIEFGITPRKTLTLKFPEFINNNLAPSFVRGYIDGDGCVGIYKRGAGEYLDISLVGTEDFIESVDKIIASLGISSFKHKIKRCKNLYEIKYCGQRAEKLGEWLYQNELLFDSKKRQTYKRYLKDFNPPYREYEIKRNAARKLFCSGTTIIKIANKVGVAYQTIYRWKKKYNWK